MDHLKNKWTKRYDKSNIFLHLNANIVRKVGRAITKWGVIEKS